MTQPRRMGVEGSKMRERFIDAAEELLRDEGYPSISARQVSSKAGLKPQLLYYYFQTMDDLILAVMRRIVERQKKLYAEALASPDPLRALWHLSSDPSAAPLEAELTSIASHRETIRTEIVRAICEFRALEVDAASRLLPQRGANTQEYPAAGIVLIATAVARTIAIESALGLTDGHKEALQIVDQALRRFGDPGSIPPPKPRRK